MFLCVLVCACMSVLIVVANWEGVLSRSEQWGDKELKPSFTTLWFLSRTIAHTHISLFCILWATGIAALHRATASTKAGKPYTGDSSQQVGDRSRSGQGPG